MMSYLSQMFELHSEHRGSEGTFLYGFCTVFRTISETLGGSCDNPTDVRI